MSTFAGRATSTKSLYPEVVNPELAKLATVVSPDRLAQPASAAQPQEETKAERKAREKEEKQQRKAEKQAQEDQEKAAKAGC